MRKAFVTVFALASLGVLLGLTMILASVVNRELTARMDELKARSIGELESFLGHRITYSSISPSFLSYLEVRDLVVHDAPDTEKPLLAIHRVRIYYSILHLLTRRDPVGSLREIRILNTNFSLDLQRDQNVIDLLQRMTQAGSGTGGLRARITGANVGITLQTQGTVLTLSGLFFGIDAESDSLAIALRGDCRGTLASGFDFSSTVGIEGRLDRKLTWSDLTVRLLAFNSSAVNLERQTVQVVWKGNQIQMHKIQDHSPIDLGMTASLDSQEIAVDFQADGLRPDRLFRFTHSLARFNNWLGAPMTASGKLVYSLKDHHLEYSGGVSASFVDQLPIHDVVLESTFSGTEKQVFFSPLRVSSPEGDIQFDGNIDLASLYPEGLLTMANVEADNGHRVSAALSIHRQDGRLAVQGRRLMIGEVEFDAFSLMLSPSDNGTAIAFESSFADIPSSRITANGDLRLGQTLRSAVTGRGPSRGAPPTLSLATSLRNVPPDRLYHLLLGAGPLTRQQDDIRSRLSPYTLSATFNLSTNLSSVTLTDGQVSVAQTDDPATAVRFGISLDSTHLSVSGLSGTWKGYPVEGAFNASLSDAGQVMFSSDFKLLGNPFSLSGRYSDSLGLYATGAYGVQIAVVPNHDGTFSLQAKGRKLPVPLSGSSVLVSFDLNGLFSNMEEWVLRAPSLIVYDVPLLESRRNTIELSGRLTPKRLAIDRMTFTDSYSTLTGSVDAFLTLPADPFNPSFVREASARFNASLKAAKGSETYSMRGTLGKGEITASLGFTSVPLERLRALSVRGSFSGTGTLSGPLARPAVNLSVSLNEGRLGNDPLALKAQVSLVPDQIRISSLKMDFLAHHLSDGSGTVDLKKGEYSLKVGYAGEYFSDHVRLTARLDGKFSPNAPSPTAGGLLDQGLQGRVFVDDILVEGKTFPGWSVVFRGDRGRLTFDGGPGNSLHGSVDSNLAFAFHMASPFPIIWHAVEGSSETALWRASESRGPSCPS